MATKTLDQMGRLQANILQALWKLGEGTVHDVLDLLKQKGTDNAYTTVLSTLQKLDKAGIVTHTSDGRMYVYKPVEERANAVRAALRQITQEMFGGDPVELLEHLLAAQKCTSKQLNAMHDLIKAKGKN